MNIMIIDNNKEDTLILENLLNFENSYNFTYDVWHSGNRAYEHLNQITSEDSHDMLCCTRPDLIFLDFFLTDINGLLLLDRLQNNRQLSNIPVILYSAQNMDLIKSFKSLKALAYFKKPLNLDAFRAFLDSSTKYL